MTTRDGHTSGQAEQWVNLRNKQGKVQARYCPALGLLLIRERGQTTAHDLRKLTAGVDEERTRVLELR